MVGDCGTNMAMPARKPRKHRPPLDAGKLDELALSYVGRFATSRARLIGYLARKLRERGWAGADEPPVEALADRLASLGYVDDQAYALAKTRSLTARGYGSRRVRQALSRAGIAEDEGAAAYDLANGQAVEAALRFAKRRSLGPYSEVRLSDPRDRERALGAMVRAGHSFGLARAIIDLDPGDAPDIDALSELR